MLQPWQKARVTRIEQATAQTRRFWLELTEVNDFPFEPGQFVTLDLPIHEKKNKRWRSYSIASWPDGTNTIELVIVRLEGGLGTRYLFEDVSVEEGSELLLRGPQGKFVLPENIDRDLYFICTGTGIAPFRSMVHHIHRLNIPHKKIHLVFGCRTFGDCLYGPELKQLEKEMSGFYHHPCFSREQDVPDGSHVGYVHGVYEQLVKQHPEFNEGKPASAYFYLCGWKEMIDEAKARILAMGYTKEDVHLELYG
ncbi:MAG: FAD-dependent oxidoreductase [Hydrotalea sp.]|nr:FAD-dependent oxidoreductase [Hydrotalea sp.]